MDNIIGIVINSETKQGDRKDGKGKWTRYAFQLEDARGIESWYSCFNDKAKEIEVGTAYEFAYEVNGDYKNLEAWMVVDADAHGLSMSTHTVSSQDRLGRISGDEFRRSKEEMRWTEAYHMATRMVPSSINIESGNPISEHIVAEDLQVLIVNWAEFFYAKLADCNDHEVTRSRDDTANTPAAPETPIEATVEERVIKPPRGRPKKAVEEPEAITDRVGADFTVLKPFNNLRESMDVDMKIVNTYIEEKYGVDTPRNLTYSQLDELENYMKTGGLNA